MAECPVCGFEFELDADTVAGHGVANVGHCHPKVVEALTTQACELMTVSNTFYNNIRAEYLEALANVLPEGLNKIFLCNSGAEAVEGAIKLARLHTGRKKIVCAMRGFHGRTTGALAATFKKEYREPFGPLMPGFVFLPFNKPEKLADAVDEETAAVLIEPVQGEGGVHKAEQAYIDAAAAACRKHNALLIFDEVQTGFGRTGKLFAMEHYGITPDILCMAKGMAGGLPMGGIAVREALDIKPGLHGSTFGGGPVVCAAAKAVLAVMRSENLPEQAAEKGKYFMEHFIALRYEKVRDVRQIGLMIGIELREKSRPYIEALMERRILALPAGPTVIRLLPPLVISHHSLDTVLKALDDVLR